MLRSSVYQTLYAPEGLRISDPAYNAGSRSAATFAPSRGAMMLRMRYGLSLPNFAEPGALLDVAEAAEASGWDGFFLWDHLVIDRASPPPISEPWTVLAAAAVRTSRIRLGTLVTPVPRRRPWVLARQVVTVDHLSGGRAVLGVGLGVPPDAEYATFAESPDIGDRAGRLDEGLAVMSGLWSGAPMKFDGAHFTVEEVRFLPSPVQQPRVPVWVAASLPALGGVRRSARWDGVAPIFSDGDEFRPVTPDEVSVVLDEVRAQRSDMATFEVVVFSIDLSSSACLALENAGATWIIGGPDPARFLDDAMEMATSPPPHA